MRALAPLAALMLAACGATPLSVGDTLTGNSSSAYEGIGTVPRPSLPGIEPVPGPDYQAIEATLISQGLLRVEERPSDAPFTNSDLARNFATVALFAEGASGTDRRAASVERDLRRFGPTVTYAVIGPGASAADRDAVDRLMARIAARTGLLIRRDEIDPRLQIYMLPRREIPDTARALAYAFPGVGRIADDWALSANWLCVALTGPDPERPDRIGTAAVFIPNEATGRLRLSCIHEEVVQSFGLPNDDDGVRPSIFNDDEEFAVLTLHDELLLSILYHPRLRAGMTPAETMRRVPAIVDELRPGG